MAGKRTRPILVSCILERHNNDLLIALPETGDGHARQWLFPRGSIDPGETPESGMRRVCREALNVEVEIVVGQPPLLAEVDGTECELRFFFCGVVTGEVKSGPYSEIRWVSRMHLREYDFDVACAPVVSWLLETPN